MYETITERLTYDLARFPWPSVVSEAIGEPDLSALSFDGRVVSRETDQKTRWHREFYEAFTVRLKDMLGELYRDFVADLVPRVLPEPCYYQAIPTFRVHLPGNLAVGEFHTDAQYGHPIGERTFWCAMTKAELTSSVWIKDSDGHGYSVTAWPGDVCVFRADILRHGNYVNRTGRSRVSFDFRAIPIREWKNPGSASVNTGMTFTPGSYYALEPVGLTQS